MNKKYVWYACYGSNLNRDRFLCYIKGGKPANSTRIEIGCSDKSLPIADEQMIIDLPLYFAQKRKHWNYGGACFLGLKPIPNNKTLSRKYLITQQQFLELVRQENADESILLDFDEIIQTKSKIVNNGLYGNIIFLGYHENAPIFTFTTSQEYGVFEFVKPDKLYIKTIINGLSEIYDYSVDQFIDYLLSKDGIKQFYTKEQLTEDLKQIL